LLFAAASRTLAGMGLFGTILLLILVFFVMAWLWRDKAAR
jgi:hypothetical protein